MSLSRADLNNLAAAYLHNRMRTLRYDGGVPFNTYQYPSDVNVGLMGAFEPNPSQANIGAQQTGPISRGNIIGAIRSMAAYYAYIVRTVYGFIGNVGNYDAYEVFYVIPGAHIDHYNTVLNAINAQSAAETVGSVAQWQVATYLDRMAQAIIGLRDIAVADLRVCHGSCHSSCHSSRGRR